MTSITLDDHPRRPGRLLVVGAAVLDRIFYVDSLPRPGETAIGSHMDVFPGGKGANQALAAAKMGADVRFLSAVGVDEAAGIVLAPLEEWGVDVSSIVTTREQATAEAVISVDRRGENMITACPGAYHTLSPAHLDERHALFAEADWLLVQFELPAETVAHALALGREYGLNMVFNPDPFRRGTLPLPEGLHTVIPNEQQAAAILDIDAYDAILPEERPLRWEQVSAEHVVVTLGPQGVEWVHGRERVAIAATPGIEAVDTVGAGDQFCGAYTAFASEGRSIRDAIALANLAAGLSVQHRGAQSGQRTRADLISHLAESG